MDKKKECKIVQDLIINYIDDILNKESKEFVNKHLESCKDCQNRLKIIKEDSEKNENKEKIELDYLKKVRIKSRIKSVFIALGIIGIIMVGYYFVKFLKINNIANKAEKHADATNYYIERVENSGDITSVIKIYYKDGKYKEILKTYPEDDTNINTERYRQINSDEIITIDHKNNLVTIEKGKYAKLMNKSNIFKDNIRTSLFSKIQKTFTYSMKTDDYMIGRNYYVIKDCYNKNNREETWVDKETGLVLRRISKDAEIIYFPGTHIRKSINDRIEDINYEFGVVTDNDVKVPDLSNYEIKYNTTLSKLMEEADSQTRLNQERQE